MTRSVFVSITLLPAFEMKKCMYISYILFTAVRCTEPPKFNYDDIRGDRIWEEGTDEPIFEAIATYTCPEGYVFEIYQDSPNFTVNFGLIEEETAVINLTCAAYGEWEPAEIPTCIRKRKGAYLTAAT